MVRDDPAEGVLRGFLLSLNVPGDHVLMIECIHAVWDGIDWKAPPWKGAGPKVYERLESRVRVALAAPDVEGFLGLLSRKCSVSTPRVTPDLTKRIQAMTPEDTAAAMGWMRRMSGVAVAYFRAAKDAAKAERTAAKSGEKQGELA